MVPFARVSPRKQGGEETMNNRKWLGRRDFVGMAAVVLARPRMVFASENDKIFRLAVLIRPGQESNLKEPGQARYWRTWHDELRRLGYVEGQNLEVRIRLAEPTRFSETVADLSAFRPDAIFAPAQNIVSLLKKAKVLTPIVAIAVNPVGSGLAASLARPGGNITGFTLDAGLETIAKRVELLRNVVPAMSRLAVLILRPYWEGRFGVVFQQVAQQLGITAIGAPFDSQITEKDYQKIFADVVRARGDSLYVTPAPENLAHRQLIADLAIQSRLPSVNFYRENVEAGGLMGYGPDIVDTFRQAAGYLDLIFKGANPAEMPFQQPTKFELTLNLKTAKALELSIPPKLLALADDVIE